MSALDLLPLAILGAVLGLDVVSFPQAMISRPIVASTAAGALLGAPAAGLLMGAVLECFAIETLPFGASRYPEWGSAAVVGGALFAGTDGSRAGALLVSALCALATAWVGGHSMFYLRRLNAMWARSRHEAVARGSSRVVVGLQLYGLTADLLRGLALTWGALLLLRPFQRAILDGYGVDARVSRAVVVGTAATVAAGAVWKLFHSVPAARWLFLGGLVAGVALLVTR